MAWVLPEYLADLLGSRQDLEFGLLLFYVQAQQQQQLMEQRSLGRRATLNISADVNPSVPALCFRLHARLSSKRDDSAKKRQPYEQPSRELLRDGESGIECVAHDYVAED
mgnify:CR=1 FL=1